MHIKIVKTILMKKKHYSSYHYCEISAFWASSRMLFPAKLNFSSKSSGITKYRGGKIPKQNPIVPTTTYMILFLNETG